MKNLENVTEVWKEFKTKKRYALFSNLGNVKIINWNGKKKLEEVLKIKKGRKYLTKYPLYRLIWECWHGKTPSGYCIHHIDWNPMNDSLINLQLVTSEEHGKIHFTGMKRNPFTDEHRQKLSESHLGQESWLKGGNLPDEVKEQISNTLKGNQNAKGHNLSDESIQQMKENYSKMKYHWYTNGIETHMYSEYDVPEGYVRGRIIK